MALKSKYRGFCPVCKRPWSVGDMIERNAEGKWVHNDCLARPHYPSANETYCTSINATELGDTIQSAIAVADRVEAQQSMMGGGDFVPSKYQEAIFDFIKNSQGNAVVEAVAGSGKTTTLVKALELIPDDLHCIFLAFNRHIARELSSRAPANVQVSTLHALGLSLLHRTFESIKIDDDKVGSIMDEFWPTRKDVEPDPVTRKNNRQKRNAMRRLVSISKSIMVDVSNKTDILDAIERYSVEIDSDLLDEVIAKLPYVMNKCKEITDVINFDDMIWLPLVADVAFDQFDMLFVDEAQDLNKSQIEFVMRSIKENGRIIAVGDRFQSMYAFRGADAEAIPNLIEMLHATVLPLSVTYRCPTLHVELAHKLVTAIQARDNAPVGIVDDVSEYDLVKRLQSGDMVICRTNAPLVHYAFDCVRRGKKAVIRGRDIGAALVELVQRFEAHDLDALYVSLNEYYGKEFEKLMGWGKELQADMLTDKVDTLKTIMGESESVADCVNKIRMLFSDDSIGVVFSSIHRAKGLEAERVYILHPELMPHPKAKKYWEQQQEANCQYVAYTRSKSELYFVR